MNSQQVVRAWGKILQGKRPSLSIEITRECPLRCPGCYAYQSGHAGEGLNLRDLSDFKGDLLVSRVLALVDEVRPLHLSIVGGDPLVRYRELDVLLPELSKRGIHSQIVTSAFREIPAAWVHIPRVNIVVSIDGLQPEHDIRRRPATYDRILKNISGRAITVHCTITSQMMQRRGYLQDFLEFWTARAEVRKVWFSIFTPQLGSTDLEILSLDQRREAVQQMLRLRRLYPKLDMPENSIGEFLHPPQSPRECIFANTTHVFSADLKSRVVPCQFGGKPDCSQCGCYASLAMAAVGHHKLGGLIPLRSVFKVSKIIGEVVQKFSANARQQPGSSVLKSTESPSEKRELNPAA